MYVIQEEIKLELVSHRLIVIINENLEIRKKFKIIKAKKEENRGMNEI